MLTKNTWNEWKNEVTGKLCPDSRELVYSNLVGIRLRISTETARAGTELQHPLNEMNNFRNYGSFFFFFNSFILLVLAQL